MLCKTFKMNTKDYTAYAHRFGLSAIYTPIAGLPDKRTMDGTLHDDILTNKATYTIKLNPVSQALAADILTEYRKTEIALDIYDFATNNNISIICKPGTASGVIGLVKQGNVIKLELGDLVFIEK